LWTLSTEKRKLSKRFRLFIKRSKNPTRDDWIMFKIGQSTFSEEHTLIKTNKSDFVKSYFFLFIYCTHTHMYIYMYVDRILSFRTRLLSGSVFYKFLSPPPPRWRRFRNMYIGRVQTVAYIPIDLSDVICSSFPEKVVRETICTFLRRGAGPCDPFRRVIVIWR